ncbi:MAG: M28 family peptidase, partial [Myxococcales bacterium]|nr:M28 family peptidase [Myxococcales bacterium]
MSHRGWALAALAWFAGVGLWWAGYFTEREAVAEARAAEAKRWRQQVQAIQAVAPANLPAPALDGEALLADVRALAFERHGVADRKRARRLIAHRLQALGYRPELLSSAGGVQVVAERPGSDPQAGTLLVGAHFDTVAGSPGANDNATGVAAALALAALYRAPTPRGLRLVFFDLEEAGLAGSKAYVQAPERRQGLVGAVILEMLGRRCTTPGCQRQPAGLPPGLGAGDVGDYLAVVGDAGHGGLLAAFRRAAGPDRPPVVALPVPDAGGALPATRRSDHAAFWDVGVGAVMVTDTADLRAADRYHTAEDTVESLDAAFF